MADSDVPARVCNGGRTGKWCGAPATTLCTSTRPDDAPKLRSLVQVFPGLDATVVGPLQWYACDNVDHQEDATTEPYADWYRREVLGIGSK